MNKKTRSRQNGRRRLFSIEQAINIQSLYLNSPRVTLEMLARNFKCSKRTISNVVNQKGSYGSY